MPDDHKLRVEAMTTAILLADPAGQAVAAEGLGLEAEAVLRASGSIIAGVFTALGPAVRMKPIEAWRTHIGYTNESREYRG